ncbi:MAG TPA: metalloregulator ArsR/SmtB family transcription factor [Acidimicrobiales bacterium]|nr:metalloregulator ArsR/SmtB family transcription factor [Acidimicrobiales bacterium]
MSETEIQREARALGDPTRYSIFRRIADADGPLSVAELTAFVGLNHNAVRQHLAVLKDAGLVSEERELRTRPGRPSLLYRLHPEAAGKWSTLGSYEWLARLLAEAVHEGASVRDVGRRDGRRRGASDGGDAVDRMEVELLRGGFRPTRVDRATTTDFVLGRCPFEEVAATNPHEVCQLHLGLAEGLADSLGDVTVERLVKKDPRRAGCRLVISRATH